MINWPIYLSGLTAITFFALAGWLLSLARHNVTHVDSMWSLFIGLSAYCYSLFFYNLHDRNVLILILVTIWALRLCGFLCWRHVNYPEDFRHKAIRQQAGKHFWFTAVYWVFGLYAVLAWVVSFSLFGAIQSATALNGIDYIGATLVILGILIETVADYQLAHFKSRQENPQSNLLQSGLWRYCRHPNYFGECCVWWGFYLIAYAGGAWWAIVSPILMTILITKVSGISRVEQHMRDNKPAYARYQETTNALLPKFKRD